MGKGGLTRPEIEFGRELQQAWDTAPICSPEWFEAGDRFKDWVLIHAEELLADAERGIVDENSGATVGTEAAQQRDIRHGGREFVQERSRLSQLPPTA